MDKSLKSTLVYVSYGMEHPALWTINRNADWI